MTALDTWRHGGEMVVIPVRGVERRVFVRRVGSGAPVVLLHGFPASSFEWAGVEAERIGMAGVAAAARRLT